MYVYTGAYIRRYIGAYVCKFIRAFVCTCICMHARMHVRFGLNSKKALLSRSTRCLPRQNVKEISQCHMEGIKTQDKSYEKHMRKWSRITGLMERGLVESGQ